MEVARVTSAVIVSSRAALVLSTSSTAAFSRAVGLMLLDEKPCKTWTRIATPTTPGAAVIPLSLLLSLQAVHLPSTDGTPSWGFLLMQDIEDGFSDLECLTDVEEVMELSNLAKAASMARPLGYTPLPYEMPHSMEDVESGLTDWEDFAEFAEGQQA